MSDASHNPNRDVADLVIEEARIMGSGELVDISIRNGKISAVATRSTAAPPEGALHLSASGGVVSSSFVEPHYHPDKAFSRFGVDVNAQEGFELARTLKAEFTEENVEARATEAFRLAVSNGVGRMRVNVDVDSTVGLKGLHGVLSARERMRGLVDIDVVAFPQEGLYRDPPSRDLLVEAMSNGANIVGGWPNVEADEELQLAHLDFVFDLAERFATDIDLHIDCYPRPNETMLEPLAERVLSREFQGRVLASHCCGLEVYPDADAKRVIARVAEAGLSVCVMPGNLSGGMVARGLSRTQELIASGVNVSAGSDNMYDGWYTLGNLDPVDRAVLAYHGAGLGEEHELPTELLWDLVTADAAIAISGTSFPVEVGAAADLVVFDVPGLSDVFAQLPGRRTTIKEGRIVAESEAFAWTMPGGAVPV